jgi:hypothetical protein
MKVTMVLTTRPCSFNLAINGEARQENQKKNLRRFFIGKY